ncbi:MAG: hypothetical protein MUE56_02215, partial [Ignavibacteria bacterium]|nr:hypothetical protein [Ignavibacteria bacterium]
MLAAVLFPVIYLISSSLTFFPDRKEICITVDDLPYASVYHKDVVNGIIITENLLKALTMALKFSASKAQLPILAHVKIEAQKEGIFVSATNLETQIRLRFAGKVIETGEAVVPGKLLTEYAGTLPLGVVEL